MDESSDDFEEESPTNPYGQTRACVLVVEDDEALRHLIVTRMRREAFEVIEATNGNHAMSVLGQLAANDATTDIDLLVMDNHMPGPSGIEIAKLLRAAEWRTPIVLITAFPEREVIATAERLGMSVLAKPFPLDRLTETAIAALLRPYAAQA